LGQRLLKLTRSGHHFLGHAVVAQQTQQQVDGVLQRAQALYAKPALRKAVQARGMKSAFGWAQAVAGYEALYD
jgi:glycogen synthase